MKENVLLFFAACDNSGIKPEFRSTEQKKKKKKACTLKISTDVEY
jgi:hypothetical protein